RREVDPPDLLEVRELGDLQAVEHDLPADAPGAERRGLPVVFFEPDVVLARVDPACLETVEIELLHFIGRRLEDHLELMVLEQTIRVLPEASIVRTTRRLDVRHAPGARTEDAEERLGVGSTRADLEVERLLNEAAVGGPVGRELENEVLECHEG